MKKNVIHLDINMEGEAYRKSYWEKEYANRFNLPSSRTYFPSRALKTFLEEFPDCKKERALDIGSGYGRNSFYLAEQGFGEVLGIEFSETAVRVAKKIGEERSLSEHVKFRRDSVGNKIDAEDESFDLVLDMMVMHSLTRLSRQNYFSEIKRLLKPGGYFVFYTIALESPAAIDLIARNPGLEEGSYRFKFDDDYITEKAFSKNELEELLSPLKKIKIEEKVEFTPAFGDKFERMYYYGVFRKL